MQKILSTRFIFFRNLTSFYRKPQTIDTHRPARLTLASSLSGRWWDQRFLTSAVPPFQHQPLSELMWRLDFFQGVFCVWGFLTSYTSYAPQSQAQRITFYWVPYILAPRKLLIPGCPKRFIAFFPAFYALIVMGFKSRIRLIFILMEQVAFSWAWHALFFGPPPQSKKLDFRQAGTQLGMPVFYVAHYFIGWAVYSSNVFTPYFPQEWRELNEVLD